MRTKITSFLLILVIALITQGQALAQQANGPGFKNPGTATLIGVLVTGGGHLYAGEIGKGLGLMGASVGAVVLGSALSTGASCELNGWDLTCEEENLTPLYAGAAISLAVWIYGIVDAPKAARRMNAKNGFTQNQGFKIQPVAVFQGKQVRPGLKLSFGL